MVPQHRLLQLVCLLLFYRCMRLVLIIKVRYGAVTLLD